LDLMLDGDWSDLEEWRQIELTFQLCPDNNFVLNRTDGITPLDGDWLDLEE